MTKTLFGIDIDVSMVGFDIDNITAKKALQDAKNRHARRWQTKEGIYREERALTGQAVRLQRVKVRGQRSVHPVFGQLELCGFLREFNI